MMTTNNTTIMAKKLKLMSCVKINYERKNRSFKRIIECEVQKGILSTSYLSIIDQFFLSTKARIQTRIFGSLNSFNSLTFDCRMLLYMSHLRH